MDAATRLVSDAGWPTGRCEALAEAIRLHMAPEVTRDDAPEAYLLSTATALDVTGFRFGDLDADTVDAVITEHPRLDFKGGFARLFIDQAVRKPGCRARALVDNGDPRTDRGSSIHLVAPPWLSPR